MSIINQLTNNNAEKESGLTQFGSFKVTSIFCINSLLSSSIWFVFDKTKLLPFVNFYTAYQINFLFNKMVNAPKTSIRLWWWVDRQHLLLLCVQKEEWLKERVNHFRSFRGRVLTGNYLHLYWNKKQCSRKSNQKHNVNLLHAVLCHDKNKTKRK